MVISWLHWGLISCGWYLFPTSAHVPDIVYRWPKRCFCMVSSCSPRKRCFTLLRCTLSFSFLLFCFCTPNILIHSTALFLIRAFKFDLDLNPSSWHFWWKTRGSKIQRSALPCAGGGHDSLSSECCNYKLVPFAHSLHQKKKEKKEIWIEWKLARRNYHTSVWSRASYRGDYSPLRPSSFVPPPMFVNHF